MRVVRIHELVEMTGLSRSTIWRLEKARAFPPRLALSPGRIGYLDDDILVWLRERQAPRSSSPTA